MSTNRETQRRAQAARDRYAACWAAHSSGDLDALLVLAADSTLTADMLATIAPGARDRDASSDLVSLVLAHPAATMGLVGRYVARAEHRARRAGR